MRGTSRKVVFLNKRLKDHSATTKLAIGTLRNCAGSFGG